MTETLALIGVEWSGARLSAWAFDGEGEILSSAVMNEPRRPEPAEFAARTRYHLAEWFGAAPEVPVIASGEIGVLSLICPELSRIGPPLTLPVTLPAIANTLLAVEGLHVVPWIGPASAPDLSCGAETILAGLEDDHGAVCIARRHTRHARLEHGRIARLATEITIELRDLLLAGGSLALRPGAPAQTFSADVFREWVEAALDTGRRPPVFAIEAAVQTGRLNPEHKAAALTGLLIGCDVAAHYDPGDEVLLVADDPLLEAYGLAFDALGVEVDEISATDAVQDGLFELADLAGLLGQD